MGKLSQPKIDQYAVFGNPIEHSKSPEIHRAFADQTGQVIHYSRRCIPIDQFKSAADDFFAAGGSGLNVTVPFKMDAHEYAHQLTERAQQAGAVNTLIAGEQKIIGDNTDGAGLLADIRSRLGWRINDARILIMGAGGAVRGIIAPLLAEKPRHLVIVNRDSYKAQQLTQLFAPLANGTTFDYCNYEELHTMRANEQQFAFDIIINGTSASLNSELPPVPQQLIYSGSHCYDMVYSAKSTAFLQWAQHCGATALSDGLGMLVCQAAEAFYQWRGVRPDVEPIIRQIRLLLQSVKTVNNK